MAEEKRDSGIGKVARVFRRALGAGALKVDEIVGGVDDLLWKASVKTKLPLHPLMASVGQKTESRKAIATGSQNQAEQLEDRFREALRAKDQPAAKNVLGEMEQVFDQNPKASHWYFLHEEEYLGSVGLDEKSYLSKAEAERLREVKEYEKKLFPKGEKQKVDGEKPRVTVCLGMIPELRKKVKDKGLEVPGIGKNPKNRKSFFEQVAAMEDPDQLLLAELLEINEASRRYTEKWTLRERDRIETIEQRFRQVVGGDADQRYLDLKVLHTSCDNFHQFISSVWAIRRGGGKEDMIKILSQASKQLGNGAIWYLAEDQEVTKAFHEIKGVVDPENDFIRGGEHEFTDFNTGEKSTIRVRGGQYGAAEKFGHYLRWISGWGFYDGYKATAANAYMAYKIHWWHEYALSKGWMEGTKLFLYEQFSDPKQREQMDILLHGLSAWPSMWHAPNRMAEMYLKKEGYLKGVENLAENDLFKGETGLSWQDKARLMIKYASSDFRDWVYSREEFENPLRYLEDIGLFGQDINERKDRQRTFVGQFLAPESTELTLFETLTAKESMTTEEKSNLIEILQKAMFKKAVGIWARLSEKQRKKIVTNTLLNDRWIKKFNPMAYKAECGVKPVVDIDSKNAKGEYRIDIADLLFDNAGQGTADNWTNNFWTYFSYACGTESLWEKLGRTDPKAMKELWENLLKVMNPQEAFRSLYGENNEETGEQEGMLERYHEETGWIMEAVSPMLMFGAFERRENGQRTKEVAVPLNELIKNGLYKRTFAEFYRRIGLAGHDNTNLMEKPLDMPGRAAVVLAGFNEKIIWVDYMKDVIKGTRFERTEENPEGLKDDEIWQALVSYAHFKTKPNFNSDGTVKDYNGFWELREVGEREKGEVYNDGRFVNYFNFALDRERAWGKKQLARLGEDGFENLMLLLGNGLVDPKFGLRRELYKEMPGKDGKTRQVIDMDRMEKFGLFSFFTEYRDQEAIVYSLLRRYYDKNYVLNPKNHCYKEALRKEDGTLVFEGEDGNGNPAVKYEGGFKGNDKDGKPIIEHDLRERTWGMKWSPYERDILINQHLRDMRDAFTGQKVLEQLKTDPNKKVERKFTNPYTGEKITLDADNVVFEEQTIEKLDGSVISIGWHPIFPLFHEHKNLRRCSGSNPVWSVTQGTGEWYPGMKYRLTPLRLHYNRDNEMYFLLMLIADAKFRKKIFDHTGRNWRDDLGILFIANPLKLRQIIQAAADMEGDQDWGKELEEKANCARVPNEDEFCRKRDEIGMFNYEKQAERELHTDKQFEQLGATGQELLQTATPGPLKGLLGPFKHIVGRTLKESKAQVVAWSTMGATTQAVLSTIGVVNGSDLLGVYKAVYGFFPQPWGLISVVLGVYLTGMPTQLIFAQDRPTRKETLREEILYDQSPTGKVRRWWQLRRFSNSLFRERLLNTSYESIVGIHGGVQVMDPVNGNLSISFDESNWKAPLHDDLVNAGILKGVLELPKSELQTHIAMA